jgi:hypothetical protein
MVAKHVAQTLKDAAAGDAMQRILDRSEPIQDIIDTLLDHWSYDLFSRKPGPAYFENGVFQPTDLDLACFMSALADRKAVIVLPHYTSRRAKTIREGERILSKTNRHGQIQGLTSNKEVFSFSVRILDQNVIQAGTETTPDEAGAYRNFMLVDIDGTWHDGWSRIEFSPTAKENDFLKDKSLWTGNSVVFKNFVHPNRWISFYGQYYLLTKALIARLEDENKFLNTEVDRLLNAGCKFPPVGAGAKKEWPKTTKGESVAEKVDAFEAEVDLPFSGSFPTFQVENESLVEADTLARILKSKVVPALRFSTRATELAFFKAGCKSKGLPAWIKEGSRDIWESGYVVEGKKKEWERLIFTQLFPGQKGIALRYRVYTKTERVAA